MKNADRPVHPIVNNAGFPTSTNNINIGSPCIGLTKREYFAAMAMQGILANPEGMEYLTQNFDSIPDAFKKVADRSIELADTLLNQLDK